ncbi:dimethylamine monooxygenase subunit DmmA family protein [Alicyclobacillus ferrooxydans]|uniref:Dimethylamine monooxygenase subunit DmmA-like C-terminal domain-containing protein n=1 Tax=Alicyclobacillus ferrooxydans TaxID=471514 RepID=A0A0P9CXP7_9BACL|nr:dimethylamine monooxygenase subunit DmmA family protein [Alicyclobacillus ferrooxydans]KPV44540.1 hypothetical protein AN477_05905 [Alicyclobacillus ferrooxydans]
MRNRTAAGGGTRKDNLWAFLQCAHSLLFLCQDGQQESCSAVLQMASDLQIAVRTVTVEELKNELGSAKIGTRLYVCGDYQFVRGLENVLFSFGITNEELWSDVTGATVHPVLCAGCYHRNDPVAGSYIHCEMCGRMLEVSNHYSKKLDAVMGYIVLPEQLVFKSEEPQPSRTTPEGR